MSEEVVMKKKKPFGVEFLEDMETVAFGARRSANTAGGSHGIGQTRFQCELTGEIHTDEVLVND